LRTEIKKKATRKCGFFYVVEGELESEKFVKLERGFWFLWLWLMISGLKSEVVGIRTRIANPRQRFMGVCVFW